MRQYAWQRSDALVVGTTPSQLEHAAKGPTEGSWCGLQIEDHGAGHRIVIEKTGFPDAVVWNPWAEKAKGMGDFGDNEYTVLCCPHLHVDIGSCCNHPGLCACTLTICGSSC